MRDAIRIAHPQNRAMGKVFLENPVILFRDGETTIKIKFALLRGVGGWGQRGKSSQNAGFRGKRHDNKFLKVQVSLSINFVVIAQAPNCLKSKENANIMPMKILWCWLAMLSFRFSTCLSISSNVKGLRFGLSLRFGLFCKRLRVPNGVFANGVFQIPPSEGQIMPENASVLKHVGAFCPRMSWPPCEHTTLKNTV